MADNLKVLSDKEIAKRIKETGLYISQSFVNKPEMYKFLGFEYAKAGKGKQLQDNILKRFFDWKNPVGQKIIVTQIYKCPILKQKRGRPNKSTPKTSDKKTSGKKNGRITYQNAIAKMFGLVLLRDVLLLEDDQDDLIFIIFKASFGSRTGLSGGKESNYHKMLSLAYDGKEQVEVTLQDLFLIEGAISQTLSYFLESALKKMRRSMMDFSWQNRYIKCIKNENGTYSITPITDQDIKEYKQKAFQKNKEDGWEIDWLNKNVPLSASQSSSFKNYQHHIKEVAEGSVYKGYVLKFKKKDLLRYGSHILNTSNYSTDMVDKEILKCYEELFPLYFSSVQKKILYYGNYYQQKGWNKLSLWRDGSDEMNLKMSVNLSKYVEVILTEWRENFLDNKEWQDGGFRRVC